METTIHLARPRLLRWPSRRELGAGLHPNIPRHHANTGLDNIGAFDRSGPPWGGSYIKQRDGTSRIAIYCRFQRNE